MPLFVRSIHPTPIVGYAQKDANASGNTMMAPTFLSVGSETGCTLADVTVTGYSAPVLVDEDEGEYDGGCLGGQFILSLLTSSGTYEARYYWIDDGEIGPGWFSTGGGKAIQGGASSVSLPAGQAVWVLGNGMKLQSAGAVNEFDVAKKTNSSGNSAVGNTMPINLTLGQLTVTGYSAPVLVDEVFAIIREINAQGRTILLVEQNAFAALKAAHRAYVLEVGAVSLSGTGPELLDNPKVRAAYLGG